MQTVSSTYGQVKQSWINALALLVAGLAGDRMTARAAYLAAAGRTTNLPQQRYLHSRAVRLTNEP
jgi:hypothetical protein